MEVSRKILDYAMWYYLRYYPSRKKLAQKLQEKFGVQSENGKKYGGISDDIIDYTIDEKMRNIISERQVCSAKIKNLIGKNKKISYIKNNLFQKQFCPHLVEEILQQDYLYMEKSLLNKEKLEKKIRDFQRKGKSIMYIRRQLIERTLDQEIIETALVSIFPEGDIPNLRDQCEKLQLQSGENKKIEKLLRQGFVYHDIKQVLEYDRV